MSDRDLIRAFKDYLESERSYSPHTVLNYINDVGEFLDYLKTNDLGSLAGINASYPRYYLSYIHNKGYASRSISRKLSSLRSFYRYLAKAE